MDAKRTEAKESWEQVLIHHRGSSSSPAFLMQAASECVTADARSPPGAQQRLKRLEFGMSKQSLFFRCPFWISCSFPSFVPMWTLLCLFCTFCSAAPSKVSHFKSQFFLWFIRAPLLCLFSNYFLNPLIESTESSHLQYVGSEYVSAHSSECEWSMIKRAFRTLNGSTPKLSAPPRPQLLSTGPEGTRLCWLNLCCL